MRLSSEYLPAADAATLTEARSVKRARGEKKQTIMLMFIISRSGAVEQLLEKNYKIHCSVHNVVSEYPSVHLFQSCRTPLKSCPL